MKLILASRSPRRQSLLAGFGVEFSVQEADLDETPLADEQPDAMTRRLAIAKAGHVYAQSDPDSWVIGGDTTVALGSQVLGKPADTGEATAMLSSLSGSTHKVISAVALIGKDFNASKVCVTEVTFDTLTETQIARYCASGEPFDKAGGYGIQGLAGAYVKELRGSYSGVVGLPMYETRLLLEQAGIIGTNVAENS